VENDWRKALSIYKEVLKEYPEDNVFNWAVGVLYVNRLDLDNAIRHYEICRKNRIETSILYSNLAYAYMGKGEYEKARQVCLDHIEYFGESYQMRQYLANSYIYEGKFDGALIEADKALALNPLSYWKEHIAYLQGDFENAEKEYKKRLESNQGNWKYGALYYLENLYRTLGQYKRAKETALTRLKLAEDENRIGYKINSLDMLAFYDLWEGNLDGVLDKAEFMWESAKDDNPLLQVSSNWWRTQAYLEQNNIEKALALAEESKRILEGQRHEPNILRYWFVLGQIEMKRKNYSKAIDLFTRAIDLLGPQRDWNTGHAWIFFNLASTYYKNGNLKEAQREYEKILTLTTGRMRWGDLYAKSYYHLGKIHEELRNRSKAIDHYEQFLDLWKDADPGLPEVEDARKQLARLKGN
jgi:tetratricopeptide (TPR) repeat protein